MNFWRNRQIFVSDYLRQSLHTSLAVLSLNLGPRFKDFFWRIRLHRLSKHSLVCCYVCFAMISWYSRSDREKESVTLNYISFSMIGLFNHIMKGDKSGRHSKGVSFARGFAARDAKPARKLAASPQKVSRAHPLPPAMQAKPIESIWCFVRNVRRS